MTTAGAVHIINLQSDVVIAGAGPAGLACAVAAAQQGLQVDLIDGMKPPIDKACGEGLLPDSLAALTTLGFDLDQIFDETESRLLRGIRFIGDRSATGNYPTTEAPFPASPGRGIRRTVLHQLLHDRAAALGVRFHWETVVLGIAPNEVRTNRQTLRTRYIVGADGHHSRIATWAKLDRSTNHSRRLGLRQHYTIAPWTDFVEVYWSNHGQAYVTPVASNEVCIAFIAKNKFASATEALTHFPALQHHLSNAKPSGTSRGSITLGRTLRKVTTSNIALIGDASGSVDAVTGEGLALCFRQAIALARAIKANNLTSYEQAHRTIQRLPHFMSRTMLFMDSSPRLRSKAFNAFQRQPDAFSNLLQVHIGHTAPQLFGTNGLVFTGLRILTA